MSFVLTLTIGKCETADKELKSALRLAKKVPKLRAEAQTLIGSGPHYNALDAVHQTIQELEQALSKLLEREE